MSRVLALLLACFIFQACFLGYVSSAVVTLESLEILQTHEWLKVKPTVYFRCKGENKTLLPDVQEAHVLYTFKGEESWQPLLNLSNKKCKRCGFYEQDTVKADDVFEEWEFCPSSFTSLDGLYTRVKNKEFNATFLCRECIPFTNDSSEASGGHNERKGMHVALIVLISILLSTVSIIGAVAAYKYWQKKKREHDQARFLKLFEDADDIEDELGLGHII